MSETTVPMLEVTDLHKAFRVPESARRLIAVNNVSFSVEEGKIIGIVGESGSGKSTLGYCLSGHLHPTSGRLQIHGKVIDWRRCRGIGAGVQMAFQDAFESLDPRWSVERSLREAVDAGTGTWSDAVEVLRDVGFGTDILRASPRGLSTGHQKVLNLVRAAVTGAKVIVADEPTSGLDLEARGRMAVVLDRLAKTSEVTFVLISHDLPFVRHLADDVYVMYLGGIVEQGPAEDVFAQPRHPYTLALTAASFRRRSVELEGEIPSPTDRPEGCPLATRCPFAEDRCHTDIQQLQGGDAHRWACWKADSITVRDSTSMHEVPDHGGGRS